MRHLKLMSALAALFVLKSAVAIALAPPNSAGPHTLVKIYLASGNPGTGLVNGDNIVSKMTLSCPRNAATCTVPLIVTNYTCDVGYAYFTTVVTLDGTDVSPDQSVFGEYPGCTGATWSGNSVVGPGRHTVVLITRWSGNPQPTQGQWSINASVTTP